VKQVAGVLMGYGLMGAVYGYLMVYGPWAESEDRDWLLAVVLGTFFAVVMGRMGRAGERPAPPW
jgi:hypothetical protein